MDVATRFKERSEGQTTQNRAYKGKELVYTETEDSLEELYPSVKQCETAKGTLSS